MALYKMLLMQLYTSHSIRQNTLGGIKSDKEHVCVTQVQKNCSVTSFQPQRSLLGTKNSTVSAIIVHKKCGKAKNIHCCMQFPDMYLNCIYSHVNVNISQIHL